MVDGWFDFPSHAQDRTEDVHSTPRKQMNMQMEDSTEKKRKLF